MPAEAECLPRCRPLPSLRHGEDVVGAVVGVAERGDDRSHLRPARLEEAAVDPLGWSIDGESGDVAGLHGYGCTVRQHCPADPDELELRGDQTRCRANHDLILLWRARRAVAIANSSSGAMPPSAWHFGSRTMVSTWREGSFTSKAFRAAEQCSPSVIGCRVWDAWLEPLDDAGCQPKAGESSGSYAIPEPEPSRTCWPSVMPALSTVAARSPRVSGSATAHRSAMTRNPCAPKSA